MAEVVYLHVGAPKTGTTYLQGRLWHSRDALAEHDVHYPSGLRKDMFDGALDLIDRPWAGYREQVRGEWDALAARVRRVNGTAVVSHEVLASATEEQVDRAMASLGSAEVHVVYTARDLGRQVPAEWQESIKHRGRRTFRKYVRAVRSHDQVDSDLWFWRVHAIPDVLRRWTRGIPPERVHLVTVPRSGGDPEELWRRFCAACAIDPALGAPVAGRTNASLGIEEIAVLRDLNRRLKRAGGGLDNDDYARLVRERLAQQVLAARPDMVKPVLGPRQRAWATETAEGWIEWVRSARIDVVGDLDDLRPTFPEGPWRNPDRPRRRVRYDVAMTALVAALQEADRRPAPEEQPLAKLGRAARRLRGRD